MLALGYALCLMTLGTSPSILLGSGSLRTLTPAVQRYCHMARKRAHECQPAAPTTDASSSSASSSCEGWHKASRQCETAVQRAYRRINLGGCTFPLKISSSCDEEWCQRGMDPAPCRTSANSCKSLLLERTRKSNQSSYPTDARRPMTILATTARMRIRGYEHRLIRSLMHLCCGRSLVIQSQDNTMINSVTAN